MVALYQWSLNTFSPHPSLSLPLSLLPSQEAMRHLTSLLPEGLKQEIYRLWEVWHFNILATCPGNQADRWLLMSTIPCVICRNMKPRAVQRPDWLKSLTSWRWYCRPMSMKSWRGHLEDCRSSLTLPLVCIQPAFCFLFLVGSSKCGMYVLNMCPYTTQPAVFFFFLLFVLLDRFQHPDVLQLVSSLNEERGRHMAQTDGTNKAEKSLAAPAASEQTTSHTSWQKDVEKRSEWQPHMLDWNAQHPHYDAQTSRLIGYAKVTTHFELLRSVNRRILCI